MVDLPVPPAPVIRATPGSLVMMAAMVFLQAARPDPIPMAACCCDNAALDVDAPWARYVDHHHGLPKRPQLAGASIIITPNPLYLLSWDGGHIELGWSVDRRESFSTHARDHAATPPLPSCIALQSPRFPRPSFSSLGHPKTPNRHDPQETEQRASVLPLHADFQSSRASLAACQNT